MRSNIKDATLELILAEDTEKVNRNEIFHTIKNIEKNIKSSDAESIANAPDISPNKAEILKQNPIRSFADNNVIIYGEHMLRAILVARMIFETGV